MEVGILTFHFVNNFGGALQAYALERVIREKCGVKAKIINYKSPFIRFTDAVRIFPVASDARVIKSGLKTFGQRRERMEKFRRFSADYFNLTDEYKSPGALKRRPPQFDKYICGSDQIWNPILTAGISPAYFLDFVDDSERKIAYAPSFGSAAMSPVFNKKAAGYVKSIGRLSVREKAGSDFIKSLTGRDAEVLIDPTFLLKKDEYSEIAKNPLKTDTPYILLYIMQPDMAAYAYARRLKEKTGVRVVEISRYGYAPDFIDETLIGIGPTEFLGLFRDAAYVCTNSYHGLIFSLIFDKKLCLVPCRHYAERMKDLLQKLNISVPENNSPELLVSYDKGYVNGVLAAECEKSVKFLNESIFDNN